MQTAFLLIGILIHFKKTILNKIIEDIILFWIVLPLITMPVYSQSSEITGKKEELDQIKIEINTLERDLKEKNVKEKQSIEIIENYNKQNLLLNKLINKIRNEERRTEKEIDNTIKDIAQTEREINNIKEIYARYVVYLYKYNREDELSYIFNSESLNEAIVRYKYFNRITKNKEKNLNDLDENKRVLETLKNKLTLEKEAKLRFSNQKVNEEKELQKKLTERKSYLTSLKNSKEALRTEIELKKQSEIQIKNIIAKLIEDEKKKAEELRIQNELSKLKKPLEKIKEQTITPQNVTTPENVTTNFSSFPAMKGKLNWPVSDGKIIRKFGENKNERLNTITLNYGVDIKTKNTSVKSIAEGIVSSITWLPGYGSVVILTHSNNFRSVYGHLGEIFISEGDRVNQGNTIGTIAESLEGNILHFEIWSERVNQNPEVWLSRK